MSRRKPYTKISPACKSIQTLTEVDLLKSLCFLILLVLLLLLLLLLLNIFALCYTFGIIKSISERKKRKKKRNRGLRKSITEGKVPFVNFIIFLISISTYHLRKPTRTNRLSINKGDG